MDARAASKASKLVALAADPRTPAGERASAGIQLAVLMKKHDILAAQSTPHRAKPTRKRWMTCNSIAFALNEMFGTRPEYEEMDALLVGIMIAELRIRDESPGLCKEQGVYEQNGKTKWVYSSKVLDLLAAHIEEELS
jgi:hypothetical protein